MNSPVKNVSIRGITGRYLAFVLLIALVGILVVAAVGSYSSRLVVQKHETAELGVLSRDISDLVRFYRQIAQALAAQQEVVDILQVGDVESAVLWANEVRSIVPESIGVALVEPSGKVMGEPMQLRLGKQCVSDLGNLLTGEPLNQPPVHRDVPSLQHFDVIVPVDYASERVGLLFISFSLDVLQRRIDERIGERQYLAIKDKLGEVVVDSGAMGQTQEPLDNISSKAIAGTDWKMFYSAGERGAEHLLLLAVAIGGIIFVVTIFITLFFSARIVRFLSADLHLIRDQLGNVHAGTELVSSPGMTHLSETEEIMSEVSGLMQKIQHANRVLKKQSMHDALTGLYNRRAFEEVFAHYCELACRGTHTRLILLDLDRFKQVNDLYGHSVGDEVLVSLAESLREGCRSSDILARLGGDEFALILTGHADHEPDHWFDELEKLFMGKQARVNNGKGIDPYCRMSAGSVVLDEEHCDDVKKAFGEADQKLYEAKRKGRGTIRY